VRFDLLTLRFRLTVMILRDECEAQVKGFTGARYKKFNNASEAEAFAGLTPTSKTESIPDSKPTTGRARSPDVEDESGWDVVYCDGACKGNGQQGSVAGVGVWWGKNDPRYDLFSVIMGFRSHYQAETLLKDVLVIKPTTVLSLS
jgi:hypothetical protein